MKIQENNIQQKEYQAPRISRIELDNAISLQLESPNPSGDPSGGEWDTYIPLKNKDNWDNFT